MFDETDVHHRRQAGFRDGIPNHPPVLVLGFSEASMLLRNAGTANVEAVIAIHGQREYPVECDAVPHRLVLRFDDMEVLSADDPIEAARARLRQRRAAEFGLNPIPPNAEHAGTIIEFAHKIQGIKGSLLCQCQGGISRSSAAALLCLASWTGVGHEAYCMDHVLSVRSCAAPHPGLVAFGDAILQRNGRLEAALRLALGG